MYNSRYTALIATQSIVVSDDRTAYMLRKDRPHDWLQRICTWVLDKLGCHRKAAVVETKMIQVDHKSLGDAIARQIISLRFAWDIQTYTVIIGRDTMAEFMSETTTYPISMEINQQVRIAHTTTSARDSHPYTVYKYMDCTVVFSPHVSGFIILPGTYTPL